MTEEREEMTRVGSSPRTTAASATVPAASAAVATESRSVSSVPASGGPPAGFVATAAGPLTIPLANVLKVVVEGYLFGDLESMATEIKPKEIGAVGYPMAMTVFSGSDLLGALTSDNGNRIQEYWNTYMAQVNELYGDLGKIADDLFRNGIAHNYLSRPGVAVVRGAPDRHLKLTSDGLHFDCVELYRDFRRSYEDYAKPYIVNNATDAQQRLNKLTEHYHLKVRRVEQLPPERWFLTDAAALPPLTGVLLATPSHLRTP
jgi:hypothetical protein